MIRIFPPAAEISAVSPVLPTAEVQRLLDDLYERPDWEVLPVEADSADLFPAPDPLVPPKPEVGLFYWPVIGARRWARADYLIAKDDLDALRAASPYDPEVVVEFKDDADDPGSETGRQFRMFLLGTRPLVENAGADTDVAVDAYVCTFVDARYYWQFSQGATGTDFASWTNLLTGIASRMGATLASIDSVDTDYLTPTDRWDFEYTAGVSSAHLLDSAAHLIGSRIVAEPAGDLKVQRPSSGNRAVVTAFHATNLGRHFGGGLIADAELRDGVPSDVETVFFGTTPAVETVSLISLGVSGYASATGVTSGAWSWVDAPASTPGWMRKLLTEQFARDFYAWQLVPLDAEYSGFTSVPVSGFVGHVEYRHTADAGYTRVRRPPENYGGVGRGANFIAAASGDTGNLLVEVTGYSSGTRYHTAKRKTWTGSPGDVADYSPATSYTKCRASARTIYGSLNYQIPTGTLCRMTPIPDRSGDYWIDPIGDYATLTTPGVVSTYSQEFNGEKTFDDHITFRSTSHGVDNMTLGNKLAVNALDIGGYPITFPALFSVFTRQTASLSSVGLGFGVHAGSIVTIGDAPTTFGAGAGGSALYTAGLSCGGWGTFVDRVRIGARPGATVGTDASWLYMATGTTALGSPSVIGGYMFSLGSGPGGGFAITYGTALTVDKSWMIGNGGNYTPGYPPDGPFDGPASTVGTSGTNKFLSLISAPAVMTPTRYAVELSQFGGPVVALGLDEVIDVERKVLGGKQLWRYTFRGGILVWSTAIGFTSDPHPGAAGGGPTTLTAGDTYYADRASGRSEFYLPLTARPGDRFRLIGRGAAGWQINQRAGQTIRTGNAATTTGTGGLLQGPQWMSVELECLNAGTDFVIASSNSPITNGPVTTPIIWT